MVVGMLKNDLMIYLFLCILVMNRSYLLDLNSFVMLSSVGLVFVLKSYISTLLTVLIVVMDSIIYYFNVIKINLVEVLVCIIIFLVNVCFGLLSFPKKINHVIMFVYGITDGGVP
jgi:hypothetical protein